MSRTSQCSGERPRQLLDGRVVSFFFRNRFRAPWAVARCRGRARVAPLRGGIRDTLSVRATLMHPQALGVGLAQTALKVRSMPGVQGKTNNEHCKRLEYSQKTVAAKQARRVCLLPHV